MNIIFIAPPGGGKGTLAKIIEKEFGIVHLSTGDLFRRLDPSTEFGGRVKRLIDDGDFVPDEETIGLVKEELQSERYHDGYILDGFPRNVVQAVALEIFAKPDIVISLEVSDKELIDRLLGRRTCLECGKSYHITKLKPIHEGICDKCGVELVWRADDRTEENIQHRLDTYRKKTSPLLSYYHFCCVAINAQRSIEEVRRDVVRTIEEKTD